MAKKNISARLKIKKAAQAMKAGQLAEAKKLYQQICAKDKLNADAWMTLGIIHGQQNELIDAGHCFKKVLTIKPQNSQALLYAAKTAMLNSELDDALAYAKRLCQVLPNQPSNQIMQAHILEKLGRWQDAYVLLKPLLEAQIKHPLIPILFASLCHRVNRCTDAAALLEHYLHQPALSQQSHSDNLYAAGNTYDKLQNYDKAFAYYQQANQLALSNFDFSQHRATIQQNINLFSADFFKQVPRATTNHQPIFIVGMPRSGSSLIEQILDSHPQITGAGELKTIHDLINELPQITANNTDTRPDGTPVITQQQCNDMAQRYFDRLEVDHSKGLYVSDKMPQNFIYLGIIALLFPQAKIIHCRRNALDTCLSCYFQNFNTEQPYSNDLGALGAYYNEYKKIMAHWKKVLPLAIFDIDYEDVTAKQEDMTRQLLVFLDLPWDEACLNFHNNSRIVRTASYEQVRQPLYKKSVQRWKNYQAHIEPLEKALEK